MGDLLDHAACEQPSHGVGDQMHLGGAGLPADELDEVIEALCRLFEVEFLRGRGYGRTEGGRGIVVEAVHPDGVGRDRAIGLRLEIRMLVAAHQELIALVAHQPQQGTLELVKARRPLPADANVSGAAVEPVERVVDLLVHTARRTGISPQVDDGWSLRHVETPSRGTYGA